MLTTASRRLFALPAALLLFVLAATSVFAQQGPRGMDKAAWLDRQMAALTEQVGLTEAQAAQVRPLLEAQFDQRQALFQQARGQGREAMQALRPQMQKLQEETDAKVEALLQEDQVAKYRAYREAQQAQRRGPRGGTN